MPVQENHKVSEAFAWTSDLSKKSKKLYNRLEDSWLKYSSVYGEESCRRGFEDAVRITQGRKTRIEGSVLSVKDMTHLVYMYDAIKKLNKFLLGTWDIYDKECGLLKELDRISDIVNIG